VTTDPSIVNNIVTRTVAGSRPLVHITDMGYAGTLTMGHNRYHNGGADAAFWDERAGSAIYYYWTFAAWQASMGVDAESTQGDPGIQADGRLMAGSPNIDAGRTLNAVVDDFDRKPRTGVYDIGAYELTLQSNHAPVLAPIAGRSVPASQDVITVALSATDVDGDPVVYSATARSLAYELDQQLGLTFAGDYYASWGGRGEKWMQSAAGGWHFLTPDGALYRWDGAAGAHGTLVGTPGAGYLADPSLLHDAVPAPHAAVTVSGSTLTIDREDGFVGGLVVEVTASDGKGGTNTGTFTITVAT
jgi:hypothetical protein